MGVRVRREDCRQPHVVAADLADEVSDLRRGRPAVTLPTRPRAPHPATSSVATRAPASARVPRRGPIAPAIAAMPKIAPLSVANRCAGRGIGLRRARGRRAPPPLRAGRSRSARRASGWRTAGRLPRAPRRSRPPAGRRSRWAAVVASAISPSRTTSSQPPAAVGPPTSSKPVASQRRPNTRLPMAIAAAATIARRECPPLTSSRLPKSSCSTFEPEW